jgi:phytoene synthase
LSDEARALATSRLAGWRSELAAIYEGTPRTPQGAALQPFVREFNLPRAQFKDLIDGVEMDLEQVRYETFASLVEYCRRVASAVGLICLEIFGYRNQGARTYAENLGLALQLTNIVRDVKADVIRGRIYLPSEDLRRFGVTEHDLRAGRMTGAVVQLLQFECERAHGYYRRAAAHLPPEDARSLVAAEIMGGIYFEILRRIERNGYDVFSARIRVPRPQRAVIALRLWMKALLRGPRG